MGSGLLQELHQIHIYLSGIAVTVFAVAVTLELRLLEILHFTPVYFSVSLRRCGQIHLSQCLRADDAVCRQSVFLLKALHCADGIGTDDAVCCGTCRFLTLLYYRYQLPIGLCAVNAILN